MSKNILELVLEALDQYVEIEHDGNIQQAGNALGVPNATFYMWIERDRTPSLKAVAPILDSLGYTLIRAKETLGARHVGLHESYIENINEHCQQHMDALSKNIAQLTSDNERLQGEVAALERVVKMLSSTPVNTAHDNIAIASCNISKSASA